MCQQNPTESEKIDDLYHLLSDQYRRKTLSYFTTSSSTVASVSEIAEEISNDGESKQIQIRLHHQALPQLDDTEILDYDARSKTVQYWGFSGLQSVIESLNSR